LDDVERGLDALFGSPYDKNGRIRVFRDGLDDPGRALRKRRAWFADNVENPIQGDVVRVRHYSQVIDVIEKEKAIRPREGLKEIFVEYPIRTPNSTDAIQAVTDSFYRPLNGQGGFVDFNVDLKIWTMHLDPMLDPSKNAKMIALFDWIELQYKPFFPLDAPGVDAQFFDWTGAPR